MNYYEKNPDGTPLSTETFEYRLYGYDGFIGFGKDEEGNCCGTENDQYCICDDECDDEGKWVVICEYCQSLSYSAGGTVTEYQLFTASTTCFGTYDWTVPNIYWQGGKPEPQMYFRNKNETTFTRTGSEPAYLRQFQWHTKTKQTRTIYVLDDDENKIPCGGYASVFYTDGGNGAILEAISPFPSFAYSEEHEAYLPVSCSRRGARWMGAYGQFSWVDGDPSTGGWVDFLGVANFLSSSHTPAQTTCPTEEETNEE